MIGGEPNRPASNFGHRPGETAPGHLWTTGEEGGAMIWWFAGGLVTGVLVLVVVLAGVELADTGRRGNLDGWGE